MMRGKSIVLPVVGLVAALLACKGKGKDESESAAADDSTEATANEPAASAEAVKKDEPPAEAEPAKVPEFAGCDLAADEQAFQGAWYGAIEGPVAWNLEGKKITWYDGSTEKTGDFQVTTPCTFEAVPGQSAVFSRVNGQLVLQSEAVGRHCGERVVGCTKGRAHVLAGDECTLLTSSPAGAPGVRRWTRGESTCSLQGDQFSITDGGKVYQAKKVDAVYLTNGWAADKVDSFATAKELVDLRMEDGRAPKTGPERSVVTAKWEKLCTTKKVGLACNSAAWERCVDLKQCHLAVNTAKLAAELRPQDGIGALDTYAVVLCQTGKKEEADGYFAKSCQAGHASNCGRECTPEVKASIESSEVKKVETSPATSASAAASAAPIDPARPTRPKRPSRPR